MPYVFMEVKNKNGKWVFFNHYLFNPSLFKTIVTPLRNIEFWIHDIRGTYKTDMRLVMELPVSNRKKIKVYSNPFPVGINPDFELKDWLIKF